MSLKRPPEELVKEQNNYINLDSSSSQLAPRRQESSPPDSPLPKRQRDDAKLSSPKQSKKKKTKVQSSLGFKPKAKKKETTEEYPNPLDTNDDDVIEIQFQRDQLTIASTETQPLQQPSLNAEQRVVVECTPYTILSIRAGAGSGKTHCMVQRVLRLVNVDRIDPRKLLVITFSNQAKQELIDRIALALPGQHLPVIKTFHSLAYSWLCRCWKVCGLGRSPTPLTTKPQQRTLMKSAIEEYLDNLRLDRCERMLWSSGTNKPEEVSWDMILSTFHDRYEADYNDALSKAKSKAEEGMPDEKQKQKMTAEALKEMRDERKSAVQLLLRVECYLALLRRKKGKANLVCDLDSRWSGGNAQCDMYLNLVKEARLGQHQKNEYLRDDAAVWEIYEKLQRETGLIDFDSMLIMFTELVLGNDELVQRFHSMFEHVIVDEFQDLSEIQTEMLNKIHRGHLTVVGDDDQCIYQFR